MGFHTPLAIADPKGASTIALELTLSDTRVVDHVKPEKYNLAAEEYARRTGDVQYLGYDYDPEY